MVESPGVLQLYGHLHPVDRNSKDIHILTTDTEFICVLYLLNLNKYINKSGKELELSTFT